MPKNTCSVEKVKQNDVMSIAGGISTINTISSGSSPRKSPYERDFRRNTCCTDCASMFSLSAGYASEGSLLCIWIAVTFAHASPSSDSCWTTLVKAFNAVGQSSISSITHQGWTIHWEKVVWYWPYPWSTPQLWFNHLFQSNVCQERYTYQNTSLLKPQKHTYSEYDLW